MKKMVTYKLTNEQFINREFIPNYGRQETEVPDNYNYLDEMADAIKYLKESPVAEPDSWGCTLVHEDEAVRVWAVTELWFGFELSYYVTEMK